MYCVLKETELFVSLIFCIVSVLILRDFLLFKTIPWNVNPNNFSIEEGWKHKCDICSY